MVPEGGELDFLWPMPLKDLWGVGRVMQSKLREMGLITVGDLARLERTILERRFGRSGGQLWDLANGLDEREVQAACEPKSVGAEETFAEDLATPEEIKAALLTQTLTAVGRMRRKGYQARTVTVKFRDGRFQTRTRARSLPRPSDLRDDIYRQVLHIYEQEAGSLGPMRLVGVSLSRLSRPGEDEEAPPPPRQRSLFDPPEEPPAQTPVNEKSARLNQALDQLAGRFGAGAVRPATLAEPRMGPYAAERPYGQNDSSESRLGSPPIFRKKREE